MPDKEASYAALVATPENGPLVDTVLDAWLDKGGFEALRQHLQTRQEVAELTSDEHAALALLWRRLGTSTRALEHWEKATSADPKNSRLWLERAGLEARLQRFPQALASLGNIIDPADTGDAQGAAVLLANLSRQTGENSARQMLHKWMEARPDDVELLLNLADMLGRFSGSEKQWQDRLRGWRETVTDPALLSRIHLMVCDELSNQGKSQEALTQAIEALAATQAGSMSERSLMPMLVALYRRSFNSSPALKPGPLELAETNMDRPDLVLALAAVVGEQGDGRESLKLLGALSEQHPKHAGLNQSRVAWMEELGLHEEAAAVLQSQQAEDSVALAFLYRDAGLQEKALAVLEKLPDTDFTQVVRAVISGEKPALTPVAEMAPTEEVNPPEPPAWQPGLEALPLPEKTARLFELWSAEPLNEGIAKALIANWSQAGKTAEAEHVCMSVFNRLETPLAQRRWCQSLVGSSTNFNLNRTLLKQGANLSETAGYWLGLASAGDGSGMEQQAGALLEAAKRMQGDEALLLKFQAAEALMAQRQTVPAAEVAAGLIGTTQDAAARLLLARIDLLEGRVNQARRVLWSLAADEAMTANQAGAFASGLLRWQEKADADAFLALQRRRFPDEPSLLMMQLFSLRQAENNEERIQSLLDLGMVRLKEPPPRSERINIPEGNRSLEETVRADWWALQTALSNEDPFQHENLEYFAAAGPSDRRYSYLWNQSIGSHLRSWAMAQLLRHAEDARLDKPARNELSMRAQKAGLPLPKVLVWARLETAENGTERIVPNLDLLEELPEEDWIVPVAGHFQQRLARQGGDMRPLTTQENRVLQKLTLALRKKASPQSLTLSLQWWRALPDSAEAKAAIAAEFDSKDRRTERLPQTLVTLLSELTPEQRKDAVLASVHTTLAAWLSANEGSAKYFGADGFAAAHCYLLLGRWQEAAKWAERSWLLPGAPGAPTPEPTQSGRHMPAWLFLEAQPVLSWPPSDALLGLLIPTSFLAAPTHPHLPPHSFPINESERSAFLSAAENLTHKPLRLLWLLKGGDQASAKALAGTWLQERPEDPVALRLAACLEVAEGRRDEALDILHSMISTRPAGSTERHLAQSLYLRSALIPSSPVQWSRQGNGYAQPPPPKHLERVRQTLLELLPEIEKWPDYKLSWLPAYKAAGLTDAVVTWERPAHMSMSTEESGDWTTGPYVRDSRQRRLLDEAYQPRRISSYEVTRLLEAGKQDQAYALMVRGLKEEADQLFLRRSIGGSDWAQLLQNPEHKARLLELAQTLRRSSPRELNHALHMAEVCGDWQRLVDWAVAGGSLLDSNPYLQSRLDLARLELGGSVAELAGKLTEAPAGQCRERFRLLMGSMANSRSFHQRLRLAELFVVMAEAPSAVSVLKEGDRSSITQSVFHSLTSAFVLPQNIGSVPALYPELAAGSPEKQPSPPPPDITPADLDKRRQLHSRLCDLALKSDAWLRHSLTHVVQRHLMENQPSEEVLKDRIKALRASPTGGSYLVEQLAQSGQGWRDMTPRLRLARLLLEVIQSTETPPVLDGWNQPQRNRLDSLMTLIGAEVPATSFPPLWALWEFPHDSPQVKHPHTPQQIEWNRERQKLFAELCDWALPQPIYRASVFPKWAGYRLFFPDTDELILKHARELKEEPGDPYSLRSFVQTAMLSYSNGHHVRCAEIVLTLLKESEPPQAESALISDMVTLLLKGRSNQASPMPPLSLRPEKVNVQTHDLSPEQQRRRIELVEEFSLLSSSPVALPPDLLLSRLEKTVIEGTDTSVIRESLIEFGKAKPEELSNIMSTFLIKGHAQWSLATEARIYSVLLSTVDGWLTGQPTDRVRTDWLSLMMRNHLAPNRPTGETVRRPASLSGMLTSPVAEGPPTDIDALHLLRDSVFDQLLAVLSNYPEHRMSYLPFRLQKLLSSRQQWPALLGEIRQMAQVDPGGLSTLLSTWLESENPGLDNSRLALLRDFVIELMPVTAYETPERWLDWLSTLQRCFLNYPSPYPTDRPPLSLAPRGFTFPEPGWPETVYPEDSGQEEHDFRRHAFIQVMNAGCRFPCYQAFCFERLLSVYLDAETEKLIELASQMSNEDLQHCFSRFQFHIKYSDDSNKVPPLRRMAVVRLVLSVFEKLEPNHPHQIVRASQKILPGDLKAYLLKGEWSSPQLVEMRQALLDEIESVAEKDPAYLMLRRINEILFRLYQRDATAEDVSNLRVLVEDQAEDALQAIRKYIEDMSFTTRGHSVGVESHRYRIAELLTRLFEQSSGEPAILTAFIPDLIINVIQPSNPRLIHSRQCRLLLERLATHAEENPKVGESVWGYYLLHQAETEEGRSHVLRRLVKMAKQTPSQMGSILKTLNLPTKPNFGRYGRHSTTDLIKLHRDLLTHVPEETGPEAYHWLQAVIDFASNEWAFTGQYQRLIMTGTTVAPEPPTQQESLAAMTQIYEMAEIRKALPAELLNSAKLRLQSRLNASIDKRASSISPFFSSRQRPMTLSYWDQVVMSATRFEPQSGSSNRGPNTAFRNLVEWEVHDVIRCLSAACHGRLLEPELIHSYSRQLRQAASRLAQFPRPAKDEFGGAVKILMPDLPSALGELDDCILAVQTGPEPDMASLDEYLKRAVRDQLPVDQVVKNVRQLAVADPEAVTKALESWVLSLNTPNNLKPGLHSTQIAVALAEIWSGSRLNPSWIVNFCKIWSSPLRGVDFTSDPATEASLNFQVAAVLASIPHTTNPDYFHLFRHYNAAFGPPEQELIRQVAKRHLEALLESVTSFDVTPTHAPFRQRHYQKALPFLIEEAWRAGEADFLEPELMALLSSRLNSVGALQFTALKGLYFASPADFVTHGRSWFELNASEADPAQQPEALAEVLHIAEQRQITLNWDDWNRLLPADTLKTAQAGRLNPLDLWVNHLLNSGQKKQISSALTDYFLRIVPSGGKPRLKSLRGSPLTRSTEGEYASPFESGEWNLVWGNLIQIARQPKAWPVVVDTAQRLGFLDNAQLAPLVINYPVHSNSSTFGASEWMDWVETAGLLQDDEVLQSPWISPFSGSSPIWLLARRLSPVDVPRVMASLKERQARAPTLGRALLRLSLLGRMRLLEPDQILTELGPVTNQISALPPGVKVGLTQVLAFKCPQLGEVMAAAPDAGVWTALRAPEAESARPNHASFWTQMQPEDLKKKFFQEDEILQRLSHDLGNLVTDGDEGAETYLSEAARHLETLDPDLGRGRVIPALLGKTWSSFYGPTPSTSGLKCHGDSMRVMFALARLTSVIWPENTLGWRETSPFYLNHALTSSLTTVRIDSVLDGRGIALDLVRLAGTPRPGSALAFVNAYSQLLGRLPASTCAEILSTLKEKAGESAANELLYWLFARAWDDHRSQNSSTKLPDAERAIPSLLEELARSPETPLLTRFWLHQAAPAESAVLNPAAVLNMIPTACRAVSDADWIDVFSRIDLRPLKEAPLTPEMREALRDLSFSRRSLPASGQSITIFDSRPALLEKFIQPLLHLLHRAAAREALAGALEFFANSRLLDCGQLLQEIVREPDLAASWVNAYDNSGRSQHTLPWVTVLPSVNADAYAAVVRLTDPARHPQRAAWRALLLAGPDDKNLPPPETRDSRCASWAKLAPSEFHSVIGNLPMQDVLELPLLPLLEAMPEVSSFFDDVGAPDGAAARTSGLPTHMAYAALCWGRNGDLGPMRKLLQRGFSPSSDTTDRYTRIIRFQTRLNVVLSFRLRKATPADWLSDALFMKEVDQMTRDINIHRDFRVFCAAARSAFPDKSEWDPLESAPYSSAPGSSSTTTERHRLLLEAAAQMSDLDVRSRLLTLLRTKAFIVSLRSTAFNDLLPELKMAAETGFLTPESLAGAIDEISPSEILPYLPCVADWLHLAGRDDAARRLIQKTLSDPFDPAQAGAYAVSALLAEHCLMMGYLDLLPAAKDRMQKARVLRPGLNTSVFLHTTTE